MIFHNPYGNSGNTLEQARHLVSTGDSPTGVISRLAARTGRSVETIRYTIKRFDEQNPDRPVFLNFDGALTVETKERIYAQHREGASVQSLANHHRCDASQIAAAVREARAKHILELPLDYIRSAEFDEPNAAKSILAPLPEPEHQPRKSKCPSGLPAYIAALYEVPLLTRRQERHLFRKLNYLKYRAAKLREGLDPARPKVRLMDKIERLYDEMVATKNQIIQANLRLVISVAKRYVDPHADLFELISEGNESLMRAINKFDYERGYKFSTYATWALKNNYARAYANQRRHTDRFRTSQDEVLTSRCDYRADPYARETTHSHAKVLVAKILEQLDPRERQIVARRFGLGPSRERKTLQQVGDELGVSKERIRQIEVRAINKLREAAIDEKRTSCLRHERLKNNFGVAVKQLQRHPIANIQR